MILQAKLGYDLWVLWKGGVHVGVWRALPAGGGVRGMVVSLIEWRSCNDAVPPTVAFFALARPTMPGEAEVSLAYIVRAPADISAQESASCE